MPDGRNPDDYKYTKEHSHAQWAWEFLRRNSDYRTDWVRFNENQSNPAKLAKALEAIAEWGLKTPLDPDIIPEGEFIWWRSELRAANPFILNLNNATETLGDLPQEVILIGVDLRYPTTELLDGARRLIDYERASRGNEGTRVEEIERSGRARTDKWIGYIRALDADRRGRS